jgi:uncharacterized protein YijF (DUF1287 family)
VWLLLHRRPLSSGRCRQTRHHNSNNSSQQRLSRSKVTTGYDPSYVKIDYPNGDVSSDTGRLTHEVSQVEF